MAPGFGEDDQIACNAAGIPTICPMDEHGRYTAEVAAVGRRCTSSTPTRDVIRELKDARRRRPPRQLRPLLPALLALRQPLVYRAIIVVVRRRSPSSATGWSSSTSRSRWVPEHIKDGSFGKWLANARDWSISRNRFWGSPIPVWQSDDPTYPRIDVYGSHRRARARLRRRRSPTCTARSSTTSSAPTPTTRPASR